MKNSNRFLEYFQGKCIFITGCTGCVGIALLEKLLRSFPQVNKIVLLIRKKKSKDASTRILNYFDNPVFSVMKETHKDYLEKIMWMEGDIVKPNLGLSEENLNYIYNKVNVFYHCAASVKFVENLKNSITSNIYGTEMVYKVAKDCKKLECFMHVSTVFCNHGYSQSVLKEEIPENPANPDRLLEMAKSMSVNELEKNCKESKNFINNYVFTKNATENLLGNKKDNIKIGILRVGCVMESYKEPYPCWHLIHANSFNVILKNVVTGIVFNINEKAVVYCTPIDLCVNALIATTYDAAHITENLKVYNVAINCPTVKEILKMFIKENVKDPWLIFGSLKYRFLCHMKDLVLEMSGKRGIYVKEMEKLEHFIEISQKFVLKELYCHTENLDELWKSLNQSERKLLFFNLNEVDYEECVKSWYKSSMENEYNPMDPTTTMLHLAKL
ncbi:PREDICTED: fatty acyl-CoA reductase 1-like isoform X2 [Nicrophorus vespilloides]|uniref:Fatty acyl-CoA reductase n=1 Tax=Nicrophorus vespilloides TaxID=110193 RepID=A0ABM1N996_NICVS|nr:PREDICTED: fatty acyl-CoA reductase 1-like isoform X2 [Nicrophorus vespilloides]